MALVKRPSFAVFTRTVREERFAMLASMFTTAKNPFTTVTTDPVDVIEGGSVAEILAVHE
jgi:hypothetical protein